MLTLVAISVLCLCAVLWSAVSIARHVLGSRRRRRPVRASQDPLTEIFFDDKMQQLREHAAIARQAAFASPVSWSPAPSRPQPAPSAAETAPSRFDLPRKAPQPAAAAASYRADWDYFNKDLGDLTDPYENYPRDRSELRSAARRS